VTTTIARDGRDRRTGAWLPVAGYCSVLVVLFVLAWVVATSFDEDPKGVPRPEWADDDILDPWTRYDAGWYIGIAETGYDYVPGQQSDVAFFPGYPLAVRTVGDAVDDFQLGGVLVTVVCGLAAVVLFWRWCRDRLSPAAIATAVAVLLLYPYGWFLYGAIYGDALFLVAALAAFLLLERDRPVLAGLAGAVATATRPVGIAVVVGLVIRALERRGAFSGHWWLGVPRRLDLRRARPKDAGVLLSVGGLVAFAAFLWHRFGDPFLFSSVQQYWDQPSDPYTWFKGAFVGQVFGGDDRLYVYGIIVQALLTAVALVSVPFVGRRFGWGYAVYVAVLVLLPAIGSKDFQGLGRYMIAAFPLFALVGDQLSVRPGVRRIVLPSCAALLALLTAGFAHGYYLA
jgi:hypothetical protein